MTERHQPRTDGNNSEGVGHILQSASGRLWVLCRCSCHRSHSYSWCSAHGVCRASRESAAGNKTTRSENMAETPQCVCRCTSLCAFCCTAASALLCRPSLKASSWGYRWSRCLHLHSRSHWAALPPLPRAPLQSWPASAARSHESAASAPVTHGDDMWASGCSQLDSSTSIKEFSSRVNVKTCSLTPRTSTYSYTWDSRKAISLLRSVSLNK